MRKLLINLAPEGTTGSGAGTAGAGTAGAAAGTVTPKDTTGTGAGAASITGEGGSAGGQGAAAGGAGAPGAGADMKLKTPDGVDAKVADPYVAVAKKHGLKGEAAQEFFDLALKAGTESRTTYEKEVADTWAKEKDAWLTEAKTDKEIGGAKFDESVALANKAVMKFGGQELLMVLVQSGIGRRKEVIAAFAKIGRSVSEDSIGGTTGGTGGGAAVSEKARLKAEFPNSPGMWQHLPD
jgi:hypothetical protein